MYIVAGKKLLNPEYILKEIGLVAGHRVADLGCGRVGQFTFPAAHIVGPYGAVYAADIQKTVVQAIHSAAQSHQLANVYPIWADLEAHGTTAIPEGTIDIALLVATLVHARERRSMLQEAVRLLKPDGKLLVIDWQKNSLPLVEQHAAPLHPEEVEQHAQDIGLELHRSFSPGPYHFGLLFQK